MARIAGRNGRLYLAIASNGTAEPIASIKSFEINANTDRYESTCLGDTSKTYVAGLPDASGAVSGVFDTATNPTYLASQDGVARKFYFYWDTVGDPTHYFFGTGFFDMGTKFDVGGLAEISGSWSAATPLQKQ